MSSIFDHIDARARDRVAATAFSDAFLTILGAVKREGDEFTTWRIPPPGGDRDDDRRGVPDRKGLDVNRS